ncbi:type I polyketide synthase [Pseudonocardia sp. HH130629-09]|uniref:type I polyketide synthase n=1 Tax=Pseudonocardia sp. HH130629-09 TaxID=1641402 RepID=UPI0006CB7D79|nr:type I polyketide synthase [Pseudonocardia sp. HH130629-09]ALE82588.1 SelA [Pseudonocardia sp. HH130629-09]
MTQTPATPVDDQVAIVGMACRAPGGVRSPQDLRELTLSRGEAFSAFPTDRGWDLSALSGDQPVANGRGGFLDDAAGFDAGFFGISPREAVAMDPQQRQLLEVSWEALERAAIDPRTLRGTDAGVFVGLHGQDYAVAAHGSRDDLVGHAMTGMSGAVASGRLAYVLGCGGPAVTLDTASSSSLVALHYAVRSLRSGECSLALAGGASVMSTESGFLGYGRQGGLSPSGRPVPFSDDADGTVWGEGVGLLVLERLADARRHGHPVLAVVRGTAVNQDGASDGLTVPSGAAQERVVARALDDAGLRPADVDVVEAHGTGTRVGDPVEVTALRAAYGAGRERPLLLGSVKSHVGHLQAAAGVISVIATVLAIRTGVLPGLRRLGTPTTRADWSGELLEPLARTTDWPDTGRPRRAGVSSFGVSGTNAHVVLEQAAGPGPVDGAQAPDDDRLVPWAVSARTATALQTAVEQLRGAAAGRSRRDVGHTLAVGRATFDHRAMLLAGPQGTVEVARGRVGDGETALLFGGRAAPAGAGRELAERFPVVATALDGVHAHRHSDGGDETATFALQVALYRLWESWGVTPRRVAGSAVGEVAAAHVAGVLSLADATALLEARALLGERPADRAAGPDPELDRFRATFAGLRFAPPRIPVVCGAAGRAATADELADPDRWVPRPGPVADPVAAARVLHADGVETFLEIGPDATASAAVRTALGERVTTVPTLRGGGDEVTSVLTALGRLHVAGTPVDLTAAVGDGRRVELPGYPFEHRTYWPAPGDGGRTGATGHPLLGARDDLAGAGGLLFSGRVPARAHPWIADHRPGGGGATLPVPALVELVLRAADEVGCDRIDDLRAGDPLPVDEHGTVELQTWLGAANAGRRVVTVHSRTAGTGQPGAEGSGWELRARATVSRGAPAAGGDGSDLPDGAVPLTPAALGERLDGAGFGPDLAGLVGAGWELDDDTWVEVTLPPDVDRAGFGLHPALLTAALGAVGRRGDGSEVPARWRDVALHAEGASAVRVRITRTDGSTLRLEAVDVAGAPVLTVGAIELGRGRTVPVPSAVPDAPDRPARPVRRAAALPGASGAGATGVDVVALTGPHRRRGLRMLVRAEAADVLGLSGPDEVLGRARFKEQGFESLTGAELVNRMAARTGLALQPGLVFDHPTPDLLAGHLADELDARDDGPAPDAVPDPAPGPGPEPGSPDDPLDSEIADASLDRLMDIIDAEIGVA